MAGIHQEGNPDALVGHYTGHQPIVQTVSGIQGAVSPVDRDINWARIGFNFLSKQHDEKKQQKKHNDFILKGAADIMDARHTKSYKSWTNTSLGGNFPINTVYGYTEWADVNMDRLYDFDDMGMGRFYQESIEENAHDIHMRFGVQKFNTGVAFFTDWFDYKSYSLGVHGRGPGIMFTLGQLAAVALGFYAPGVLIVGWLMKMVSLIGGGRFWYVAPTMPLYWTSVNNLFNRICGDMGLTLPPAPIDGVDMKYNSTGTRGNNERSYIGQLVKMLPGVYQHGAGSTAEGFTLDVRRIATRCQRLENQMNLRLAKQLAKVNIDQIEETALSKMYDEAFLSLTRQGKYGETIQYKGNQGGIPGSSTRAYLQEYLNSRAGLDSGKENTSGKKIDEKNKTSGSEEVDPDSVQGIYGTKSKNLDNIDESDGDGFLDLMKRELNDGSAWITFRVDGTKSVGESFSNSTQESQIASLINGWSATKRQLQFSLMGGSIFGDLVNTAIDGGMDMVAGMAKSLGMGGLAGFMYGSKIDIPKTYSDSSASLPRMSYTIKLRTPYGHPICIAQDLYYPLCCILVAGLPISHGRAASGSPFYCELYDRGRAVIKNGIISNIRVERATSNVAWTKEGFPLGLDVTFDVENLDTTVHMPIATMSLMDHLDIVGHIEKIMIGNEGAMAEYIGALGALSLPDQIYQTNIWSRNYNKWIQGFKEYWDKDHFVQRLAQTQPGRLLAAFQHGTTRR